MELELYKMEIDEKNEKVIEQYKVNLSKISVGRANPNILNSIKILYYDELTPINQIASISIPEPRQLLIKPFDQSMNKEIVKIINSSSLGITANDEGNQSRIDFPALTTERRKELVKSLASYTEQAKVQVRQSRQDINKSIKSDNDLSEDIERDYLDEIQKMTDKYISNIDSILKEKEKDLMTM